MMPGADIDLFFAKLIGAACSPTFMRLQSEEYARSAAKGAGNDESGDAVYFRSRGGVDDDFGRRSAC